MTIIYRKTAQGQAEIDTRTRRLSPRVRSALVMVDGRRSDDELHQLVAQLDEALTELLEAGLIEAITTSFPAVDIPLAPLTSVDISLATEPGPLDAAPQR